MDGVFQSGEPKSLLRMTRENGDLHSRIRRDFPHPVYHAKIAVFGQHSNALILGIHRQDTQIRDEMVFAQTAATHQQNIVITLCRAIFQRFLEVVVFFALVGIIRDIMAVCRDAPWHVSTGGIPIESPSPTTTSGMILMDNNF